MWSDSETSRDFLNFRHVADIAAEMIAQAGGSPLSLSIAGSWGIGKSSMMKLLAQSLRERSDRKFLFVEFNAWLYQGYDDTRAALMEVIARALVKYAEEQETPIDKAVEGAKSLLKRVNWFRLAATGASTAVALSLGFPPVGLLSEGVGAFKALTDGDITQADIDAANTVGQEALTGGAQFINKKGVIPTDSPPKAIHDFREELKSTLKELGVTLIVLIDDLDRCLPPTAIATLEAMRLFLFIEHTAFVIAADDKMIKEAVRARFKDVALDDDTVTNYFDKLIQVPIRVPPLGTQDVRAYLMLLFIENSGLPQASRDRIRQDVCKELGQTWMGKRVDRAFISKLVGKEITPKLASQLDLADRIAPLLTSATKIAGNPRLIKRFLNTLSIRQSIARALNVNVDEAALAKLLLFERCASQDLNKQLLSSINESEDGKPELLKPWEEAASKDPASLKLDTQWDTTFIREWLALQPSLSAMDMRGIVYVSREHVPIITAADQISSDGIQLLEALTAPATQPSRPLAERLKTLPPHELLHISERILTRAKTVTRWGTPQVLNALLTLALVPGEHIERIANFLRDLPRNQLTAAIVPLLSDKPWAAGVLQDWRQDPKTPDPVKRAIANTAKKSK